jgi:hypothetical protein
LDTLYSGLEYMPAKRYGFRGSVSRRCLKVPQVGSVFRQTGNEKVAPVEPRTPVKTEHQHRLVAMGCWFHFNRCWHLHSRKYLFVVLLTTGVLKIVSGHTVRFFAVY